MRYHARFVVLGSWGRHRRRFWVDAEDMTDACYMAKHLAKFYATGKENFTTQTWRYGSISVKPVDGDQTVVFLREERAYLRVVR